MRIVNTMTFAGPLSLTTVVFLCTGVISLTQSVPDHRYQLDPFPFEYGVASGDPLQDAVLLWTRATNQTSVVWSIWVDGVGSFESNVTSGVAQTDQDVDFVVHIDATGLSPRTRYAYAFEASGVRSRTGKTKTAPAANDASVASVKVATFSCACHWCGFLNGYREIAADSDVDIVIGLGDWLYPPPYLSNLYGGNCARVPAGMCYTEVNCDEYLDVEDIPAQTGCDPNDVHRLTDMRHYHKILNTDVDVRDLRAAHPLILIPDNHDINDDRTTNLTASPELTAWLEWVPTRYQLDQDGTLFFPRLFRYGTLLDIVRLDTRNIGRNEDPPTYLGQAQIDFFENVVFGANKTEGWRIMLTSQVFMPWTIQEKGYVPLLLAVIMMFNGPLLLGIAACAIIRYRRRRAVGEEKKAEDAKLVHYSQNLDKSAPEVDSSRMHRAKEKVSVCCLSNACMGVSVGLFVLFFALLIAGVFAIRAVMDEEGISANAAGVPNIQSGRSRAWDGDNNPIDRAAFMAQMKRLGAFNNIFITGDMHISLAADVLDTAEGVGPPSVRPSSTTRFGVEFLPSSVSKGNLDERVARDFGYTIVPLVKWFFETGLSNSNDHFRFFEAEQHGYGIVTITPQTSEFVWRHQRYDTSTSTSTVARRMTATKDRNRYN